MRTNTLLCYVMLLGIFCMPGAAFGATIYKWVDQNGVTHFSDRKPEQTQQIKGPVQERVMEESLAPKAIEGSKPASEAKSPLEKAINGTFTIKGAKNIGTGFFISSNGYAMTCQHVIENSPNPVAQLDDQSEYPVKVVSMSGRADLALLLVSTPHKTPYLLTRNPGTLKPGDRVYAIGAS
ncbi:MAG: trypsin-like peptidase domain-containing protein, partial [Pseudomonadota bacterium]